MPQFDIATFTPQLFWLFVCYITLLIFSARVALPRLENVLSVRWQHIEGALEEAQRLNHEAESLVAALEEELAEARKKAHHDVVEASRHLNAELTQKKGALANQHKQRFRDSERVILQKKATTMGYVQDIATDVTSTLVSSLLAYELTNSTIQEAVGERAEKERRSHAV